MTKKSEERLKWALRYVLCHPDMSPALLAEEWKISINYAIKICAHNVATFVDLETGKIERTFESMEKSIYKKLMELK